MTTSKDEMRAKALEGKSEREVLEMKAHWSLSDLSDFFKQKDSPLMYEVNKLIRRLDEIRVYGLYQYIKNK